MWNFFIACSVITVAESRVRPGWVLAGELDGASAVSLSEQLRQVTANLVCDLVVDVGLLTFIDSTGLSLLVSLQKRVRESGRALTVVDPTPMARRLFQITGLDQVLTVEPAL
jgi:anti-anti-sigma factor